MSDRFDTVVRGLVGIGVVACVVAAAVIRPAALPPEARSAWLPVASAPADAHGAASAHVAGRTFALDTVTIGSRTLPFQDVPYAIERGAPLQIRGWAIDPVLRRTADRVAFRVDGGSWNDAAYRIERPDVADALHEPLVADCGFLVTVSTDDLAPREHTIEIATLTGGLVSPLPARVGLVVSAR